MMLPSRPYLPNHLSLTEKIGQCVMPAAFINDDEEDIQALEALIRDHHIGALCFFHSRASAATNFEGKKKVVYNDKSLERLEYLIQRYQKAARYPLLITMDAEWGLAMRVEQTPQYPYALTLGALTHRLDLIRKVGNAMGQDCRRAGVHWNLAPVVDVNSNPDNPVIGYRAFGDSVEKTIACARALMDGMAEAGTLNALKHFPGHGDTDVDSHLALPAIQKDKKALLQEELRPFMALMHQADAIMTGHLRLPFLMPEHEVSASLSPTLIQELLRKEMGYTGVVITDALNMHAVSKQYTEPGALEAAAFAAGNDMLCFSEHIPEGIDRIRDTQPTARIEASFLRIWALKEKVFSSPNLPSAPISYDDLMAETARESLTLVTGSEAEMAAFRQKGYALQTVGHSSHNAFLKGLPTEDPDPAQENVLLALFAPKMKAKEHFGLEPDDLARVDEILRTKKTILYVFGNPYLLNQIAYSRSLATVLAYQDLPAFQRAAATHFTGGYSAKGTLPITLNPTQ